MWSSFFAQDGSKRGRGFEIEKGSTHAVAKTPIGKVNAQNPMLKGIRETLKDEIEIEDEWLESRETKTS
jgi:hypothetical protein